MDVNRIPVVRKGVRYPANKLKIAHSATAKCNGILAQLR
jgi:hypothetical protein